VEGTAQVNNKDRITRPWWQVAHWSQCRGRFAYLGGVIVGLVLFLYVAFGIQTGLEYTVSHPIPATLMGDFKIYQEAYVRASRGADPYTIGTIGDGFFYPAPTLLLMGLFAAMPAGYFQTAFYLALNIGLLTLVVRGIASHYGCSESQWWWWLPLALCFAPVFETLHTGQINLITLFGIFLVFVYADKAPLASGLGLSLAIVTKFTPIALFAYLVVARCYRAVAWAIIMLACSLVASFFLFGGNVLWDYPRVLGNLSNSFVAGAVSQSLVSVLHRVGWLEQAAWFDVQRALTIYLVAIFAVSAAVAFVARQREPFFLIIALGTAVMPNVMWYHHYVFLLVPLLVWLAWSRFHPVIVLWCFLGLIVIQVNYDYWARGLLPHLFAHLSIWGILGWQLMHAFESDIHRRWAVGAGYATIGLIVLIPFQNAMAANENMAVARAWIEQNLPPGARVAVEERSPFVAIERFTIQETTAITDRTPEWYLQNGFEYLIFGYGVSEDDCHTRASSQKTATRCAVFFARFPQVARFEERGYDIRILKTDVMGLPSQRSAVRFGLYGGWLELVGYDLELPRVTMYWRALESRREPLQLTARLRDATDREIAHSSSALFGVDDSSGRWREGITRVEWTLPALVEPGMYRLELNVEVAGLGRVPVLSRTDEPISDKLFIGPFKVSLARPSPEELQRACPANIRFDDAIVLQSYALSERVQRPGDVVDLTLYWQSAAKIDKDYTIFVHLLDASGNVRAQIDAPPRDGAYPTSIWDAGEIVRDNYILSLPRDLAPGDYRIEVGLYEYPVLTRLIAKDANGTTLGNRLILNKTIRVAQ
jgi:hypothetical protein